MEYMAWAAMYKHTYNGVGQYFNVIQYYHHLVILGPAISISLAFSHFNNIACAI